MNPIDFRDSRGCFKRGVTQPKWMIDKAGKSRVGKLVGEKHPNWKGGTSSIRHKMYMSYEWKQWRKSVFKRDNHTCQWCLQKGGYLEAHHRFPVCEFPDLVFVVGNGVTLCRRCHSWTKRGNGHLLKKWHRKNPQLRKNGLFRGRKHTKESKLKMSKSQTGRKNEGARQNMLKNNPMHNPESVKKMSETKKRLHREGKFKKPTFSIEQRKAISIRMKLNNPMHNYESKQKMIKSKWGVKK